MNHIRKISLKPLFVLATGLVLLFSSSDLPSHAASSPLPLRSTAPLLADCEPSITVTSSADSGPGTLRQAIADVCEGGVIDFALPIPATITLTSSELLVSKSLTLAGPGADQLTISGNNARRVFNISGQGVTLDSLAIKYGRNYDEGGGVFNTGNLTLSHCLVASNYGDESGGGLYNAGGEVTILDTTISDNFTWGSGGGLYNVSGIMTISDSTISDNTYEGLRNNGGTVTLFNTTLSGNGGYAVRNGYSLSSIITIINSTFSENGSYAIQNDSNSTVNLVHSTIYDTYGTALSNASGYTYLQASIIASGYGNDCTVTSGNIVSLGYNLGKDNSCNLTQTTDLPNTDPKLAPLADNGGDTLTHALLPGSPAIDHIPPASCTQPTDQRGIPRPQGEGCDIGAYEASGVEVSIAKTATVGAVVELLPNDLAPGDPITFTLAFSSTGLFTATEVLITDPLPTEFLLTAVLSSGVAITDTGAIPSFVWQVADLAPGAGGVITLSGVVSPSLTHPQIITNTATITSPADTTPANNTASASVRVCGMLVTVTSATDSGAGSLRQAIADSCSGATVDFALTTPAMIALTSGPLMIEKPLSISGPGADLLAISGNDDHRVFGINADGVTLHGLTIRDGYSSGDGGGIYNSGILTLTHIALTENYAILSGGGLYNANGVLIIGEGALIANTAGDLGGGLFNSGGSVGMVNVTLSSNEADFGGGMYNGGGAFSLGYVTVSANTAINGGGLYSVGNIKLQSSLLSANSGGDCATFLGNVLSLGYNLDSDGSCNLTQPTDLSNTDPLLDELTDNGGDTFTHALLAGSPAIDHIPPSDCLVLYDQRRVARPQGEGCDIGAYEFQPPLLYLDLRKTVDRPAAAEGEVITFTLLASNNGPLTATNVTISDTLHAGLQFLGPVTIEPPDAGQIGAPPILAYSITLAVGESVTVTFPARPLDGPAALINTATVTSTEVSDPVSSATTVNVTNLAPLLTNLTATVQLAENGFLTLSSGFSDPGLDSFTLSVDWGDGQSNTFDYPIGATVFSETHRYLDDDPSGTPSDLYTLTLTMTDDDGGSSDLATLATRVNNLPPDVEAGTDLTAREGDIIQFFGSYSDPGTLDTHTILWDFGDGVIASRTLNPTHSYLSAGIYTVTLTVTDDDTGVGSDTLHVTVTPCPVLTVTSTADSGPGTLRQAIVDVCEGGTIDFAFTEPTTITLTSGQLTIDKPLTIAGPGVDILTISGNDAFRVMKVTAETRLSGLTLAHGYIFSEDGGGIYNSGNLTLANCAITDNWTNRNGGGIYSSGVLTIDNCTLSNNASNHPAGGIYNMGTLTMSDSTVTGNIAAWDGGGMINWGTATINRSSFTQNQSGDDGGGILNYGLLTLADSLISANTANDGGGLDNTSYGTAIITHCVFIANTATSYDGNGGAIYNSGGSLTLDQSTLSANSADDGGGLYNAYDGSVSIALSTFTNNTAEYYGGGAYASNGTVSIVNSVFYQNSAKSGGGLYALYGSATITNTTFSANAAEYEGGGVYTAKEASITLVHATIAENTNGGVRAPFDSIGLFLQNTIVANNIAFGGDCYGPNVFSLGYNLATADTCHLTQPTDLPDTDPRLGPLSDNGGGTLTRPLQFGSPAIDPIPLESCPVPDDQRGVSRPFGFGCDIGAYEYALPYLSLSKTVSPTTAPEGDLVTYTIMVSNIGILTATDVTISDLLPGRIVYAGPTILDPPDAGIIGTHPTLAYSVTLTTGESVTVTFAALALEGPATLDNTATATSAEGTTLSDSATLTITNVAPVVDAGPDQTVPFGSAVQFDGSFSDPSGKDTHTIFWDFGNGQTITDTLTPTLVYFSSGLYFVTLTVTDDDGAVGSDTLFVTVQPSIHNVFLPLVRHSGKPDLVASFTLTPDKLNFDEGESVLITAIVTNQGNAAAPAFWMDFYLNPSPPPNAANIPWSSVCGITPCYGIAWLVPVGLLPGRSITLTSTPDSYSPVQTVWPGYFVAGTTDLYLYVDSWNPGVSYGAAQELDETNNRAELHGLSVQRPPP